MAGAADFAQQLSVVGSTMRCLLAQDWLDNSEGTIEEGEGSELSPALLLPLHLAQAKRSRQIWESFWTLHRKSNLLERRSTSMRGFERDPRNICLQRPWREQGVQPSRWENGGTVGLSRANRNDTSRPRRISARLLQDESRELAQLWSPL